MMAGRGRSAISNFLLSHLAACRTKSMNKWSAGVFPFWPRRSRRGEKGPTRMDPAKVRAWFSPEDDGNRVGKHYARLAYSRRAGSRFRQPPSRPRFLPEAGGGAFGDGRRSGAAALSSFARAERNGSKRGARGNLSASTARRMAAITAACSSSVRSIVGMVARRGCGDGACGEFCHQNLAGARRGFCLPSMGRHWIAALALRHPENDGAVTLAWTAQRLELR
jgi:hypothetical protein